VQRDHAANQRDQAADERDRLADIRDQVADVRDQAGDKSAVPVTERITVDALRRSAVARLEAASDRRQASQDRRAAADERRQAERDRDTAWADRDAGADERELSSIDRGTASRDRVFGAGGRVHAERDRSTASADRGASADERESASVDGLTGVHNRSAGLVELEREIARVRRTEQPLVLAFLDVDQLKAVNDSGGHAAGDRVLVEVANAVRAQVRPYDLIIRYGGDEFLCACSGLEATEVIRRLGLVNAVLAEASGHASISTGIAMLRSADTVDDLIARADAALYRQRHPLGAASSHQ
jgi:diguanylate cyclase (GGDEF)-like protein